MEFLKPQLKASTLIESIVGMVILITSFGISSIIFLNVMTSSSLAVRAKAKLILSGEAAKTKKSGIFLDEVTKSDGLTIEKSFYPISTGSKVLKFQLKAKGANGKLVSQRNELILSN